MVVWIYDEKGYPSGAAGGLVLKENPEYEATELAFDASRTAPFLVRRAYEHTHASNNFFAARRYINLIDDRAVRSFIANTHEAYFTRLGPYFGTTVQATFTDEPSLITIDLGSLKKAVVDPIDPNIRPLPAVPWCYDLAQRFRERDGRSAAAAAKPVRGQFAARPPGAVPVLVADRRTGGRALLCAIQTWCAGHHIASSGHTLWEEQLLHHVPLEGNALKVLGRMDVPGLDMLTSDPEQVVRDGWMTAALPASAAALYGRRRVMTEISDFSQTYGGHVPATLPEMEATAAWQAAWGVTDFNLYYSPALHAVEKYRAYCEYVGRLNAILKPAAMAPQVLLYYPIYDLWAEYLPVAERLQLQSQSQRAQQIVNSFTRLGQLLQQSQIAFMLTDHENLAAAVVRGDGKLAINGHAFDAIVLPDGVELPADAANVVERFRRARGRFWTGPGTRRRCRAVSWWKPCAGLPYFPSRSDHRLGTVCPRWTNDSPVGKRRTAAVRGFPGGPSGRATATHGPRQRPASTGGEAGRRSSPVEARATTGVAGGARTALNALAAPFRPDRYARPTPPLGSGR